MEDKSATRTAGPAPIVRVYHSHQLDLGKTPEFCTLVTSAHKPEQLTENDLWIEAGEDDSILISTQGSSFFIPLEMAERWLSAWCQQRPTSINSISRLQKTIRKFVSTIVDARLVNTGKHPALMTFLGREKAQELERGWRSPHMLPQVVLGLKDFSEYETCQIMVHERGRTQAESWGCTGQRDLDFSKTSAKNFTKIFNLVRKSKSKLFDQGQAMLQDVQVVGNFLARDFSFQNHSVLLFLSRNGFLAPTHEELTAFNTLTEIIAPYLERLLAQERSHERMSQLIKLLEALPLPLEIRDSQGALMFANRALKMREETSERNLRSIELPGNWQLNILESDDKDFDIDHHRRVSLLGELLNTLQHELNNPLFGLHLTADVHADENSADIAQMFREIALNASRCQTIIKNFSQLYSASENNKKLKLAPFLEEVLILTKSEIRGIKREIIFENLSNPHEFELKINPVGLSQILFNLVINAGQAIKAMVGDDSQALRQSSIILRVIKQENILRFQVEDTGPGLSEDFLTQGIKPFYTTKAQGTGLGLTISHGLLESFGSRLEFAQNPAVQHGAIFAFELKNVQ